MANKALEHDGPVEKSKFQQKRDAKIAGTWQPPEQRQVSHHRHTMPHDVKSDWGAAVRAAKAVDRAEEADGTPWYLQSGRRPKASRAQTPGRLDR